MEQVVKVALFSETGDLLLQQRGPDQTDPGMWGLVGGHVNPGESLERALVREVLEETGVLLDLVSWLGAETREEHRWHYFMASVRADLVSGIITEGVALRFVPRDDLASLPVRDHVSVALRLCSRKLLYRK